MKKNYKTFADLYTEIIKDISDKSGKSIDSVVSSLSEIESIIKSEYEATLIMDKDYYIKKFIGRLQ